MISADCHYGDHSYGDGARCKSCGYLNAGLLTWLRVEKAEREGRHHGDHFHNTLAAAATCKRPEHDAVRCAANGGCLHHEPSDDFRPDFGVVELLEKGKT